MFMKLIYKRNDSFGLLHRTERRATYCLLFSPFSSIFASRLWKRVLDVCLFFFGGEKVNYVYMGTISVSSK